jgi:GNAT superfamily N-acetyltransferase
MAVFIQPVSTTGSRFNFTGTGFHGNQPVIDQTRFSVSDSHMQVFEEKRGEFVISTDRKRLNFQVIFDFLTNRSYWARGRSVETVANSIENSLCFGIYEGGQQVAFARVVTDYATFGWICDVFVLESHRNRALSKWLVETIVRHPQLISVRRLLLATEDAHELYRKYGGFDALPYPERWMSLLRNPPKAAN